jgi:hypothetical protein
LERPETGGQVTSRNGFAALVVCGIAATTAPAADLSRYRDFQLGAGLDAIGKQTGVSPLQAKTIHRRPALLQELEWRPQPLRGSSSAEPVKDVLFSFYNGELFRIVVNYDRQGTEGLTNADLADAIAIGYGPAVIPTAPANIVQGRYGDQDEIVAEWQDALHRFILIRSTYGPGYRLVGVLKRLEAPAEAAKLEAVRLDDLEAPRRDAERLALEGETERAKLEKARIVNKPKFRP